jgi:hypothetical protein
VGADDARILSTEHRAGEGASASYPAGSVPAGIPHNLLLLPELSFELF